MRNSETYSNGTGTVSSDGTLINRSQNRTLPMRPAPLLFVPYNQCDPDGYIIAEALNAIPKPFRFTPGAAFSNPPVFSPPIPHGRLRAGTQVRISTRPIPYIDNSERYEPHAQPHILAKHLRWIVLQEDRYLLNYPHGYFRLCRTPNVVEYGIPFIEIIGIGPPLMTCGIPGDIFFQYKDKTQLGATSPSTLHIRYTEGWRRANLDGFTRNVHPYIPEYILSTYTSPTDQLLQHGMKVWVQWFRDTTLRGPPAQPAAEQSSVRKRRRHSGGEENRSQPTPQAKKTREGLLEEEGVKLPSASTFQNEDNIHVAQASQLQHDVHSTETSSGSSGPSATEGNSEGVIHSKVTGQHPSNEPTPDREMTPTKFANNLIRLEGLWRGIAQQWTERMKETKKQVDDAKAELQHCKGMEARQCEVNKQLQTDVERLSGKFDLVMNELELSKEGNARVHQENTQIRDDIKKMQEEVQHLKETNTRLLEEKGHLESELQVSMSTASNLSLENREAMDTIVMLNEENTKLDEEANKLSEERDKALRTATVTQRKLADLSRRSVRTMQLART